MGTDRLTFKTGLTTVTCNECGKSFTFKSQLGNVQGQYYKCSTCETETQILKQAKMNGSAKFKTGQKLVVSGNTQGEHQYDIGEKVEVVSYTGDAHKRYTVMPIRSKQYRQIIRECDLKEF